MCLFARFSAVLLALSSCTGEPDPDSLTESRIRTGAVCAAYDDVRGRIEVDTADAERVELHRAAMEVCDVVEAEGGGL